MDQPLTIPFPRAADAPVPARHSQSVRAIVAAAILSASLASVSTAAIVERAVSTAVASTGGGANAQGATSAAQSASAGAAIASGTADSIVAAAAVASPAVVTISTTSAVQGGPFADQVSGVGSGFIYNANGWILTNAHVVEGASSVTVALSDGRTFAGLVAASNASADVAVVKIDAAGLPTVTIGSSSAASVGETVIAIGSPLGTYSGSVTSGVLSATGRTITVGDSETRTTRTLTGLLQTDAAINEGNSGGPLLDVAGRVIGIVTASSSSAEGIGFAIPIAAAATIMAQASANAS